MRLFGYQKENAGPLILEKRVIWHSRLTSKPAFLNSLKRKRNIKLAGILLILLGFHILPVRAQWEQLKMGNENWSGRYLAGTGSHIFAVLVDTTNSKLYVSQDDGNTWQPDTTFPTKKYINSVTMADSNVYAATDSGVFRSADWGKTWKNINGRDSGVLIRNDTNLILDTQNDGIFYSSNEGKNWTKSSINAKSIWGYGSPGPNLIISSGNPVYSDGGHIYHSLDNGKDWTVINDTLKYITVLASNGADLFAGRYIWPIPAGTATPPSGFFRSTDQGKSWEPFESGLLPNSLATFIPHGDPVAIHGTKIFAGERNGIYVSDVSKADWKDVGQGLPQGDVESVYTNNSYIFIGIGFGGIWRRPISQVTAIKRQPVSTIPTKFQLEQNYPNPFNPTTNIRYKIPARAHVRLTVYNVLGKQVETLVNKEEAPGQYSVQFNALKLGSGVYLYRLRAGNFVETEKMVLVK